MTNEERKQICMNRNVKMHPLLNGLTWDVIFVWTISTMFLTTQKGLSYAQTITLDSILMIFGCLFCVPAQKIFQNMKSTDSIRVGLLGYAIYLLICILAPKGNFFMFVLAQPFLAFGYAVNAIKVNVLLTDSLNAVGRDKEYQKISGKGFSIYYIIECVGAVIITYIYSWNPYAAYWVSFGVAVFGIVYSFLFKEPKKFQDKNINIQNPEQIKPASKTKKPDGYFKILSSWFFISLLIYAMIFRGVASITASSYKIYLNQMIDVGAIPLWLFGYLFAMARLVSAILSKYQFKFNLKFGVKSLIIINVLMILTFLIRGLLCLYNPTAIPIMVIIIILSCVNCALRMPNQIFINNYMQVCVPKKNIEKAYAIKTMIEYLGYAVISALFAGLLTLFNDNWGITNIVYAAIISVPLIVSLIVFIKALIRKHAQKFTVIKDEYTKD